MFPLYKKELNSYFLTPFVYAITAAFMFLFTSTLSDGISKLATSATYMFSYPNEFYNYIFYLAFFIPILTMRSFADERKFNTEVLLMTSPLNVFKIVLSKFAALITVLFTMLAATTVFPYITHKFGDVVVSSLIAAYIGFFLWGMMCLAIGMFFSALTDNSIVAAITAEIAMLALLAVDKIAHSAFAGAYPNFQRIIIWFSAQPKFQFFAQGLVRLSDIVFFLSVTVVFLVWTIIAIEKRRWTRA